MVLILKAILHPWLLIYSHIQASVMRACLFTEIKFLLLNVRLMRMVRRKMPYKTLVAKEPKLSVIGKQLFK